MNASLLAICPKHLVDTYLKRIERLEAYTDLLWSHSFSDEMEHEVGKTIKSQGYARVFIYETKSSGGGNIRLAAHIEKMSDIERLQRRCMVDVCKTRFHVVGYEVFDPPLDLEKFKHLRTRNVFNPRMISGQFGLTEDINVEGITLAVLCRMKWNDEKWQRPAPPFFNQDAILATEEWNLNEEDTVNGNIYGYFEGRPANIEPNEPFTLHLVSKSQKDEYFLVGRYEAAEATTQKELDYVDSVFELKGIYDRRVKEVFEMYSSLDPAWSNKLKGKSREEKLDYIKSIIKRDMKRPEKIIKCPVNSVMVFDPPIRLTAYLENRLESMRYSKARYLDVYPVIFNPESQFEPDYRSGTDIEITRKRGGRDGTTAPHGGGTTQRKRTISRGEIQFREAELVDKFRFWLRDYRDIPLVDSPREVDYADVLFTFNNKQFKVEAKYIYGTPSRAIRRAIGQLLDYNLYPGMNCSDIWLVLLNEKPDDDDFSWLAKMRKRFSNLEFPVYLCWEENGMFESEEKII